MLQGKTAIVYGGGGALGAAAARALARDGARLFLAGRTQAKLDAAANDIRAQGGTAESAVVDALDGPSVNAHADLVASMTGRIDIMLNATGFTHVQGRPFADLSYAEFALPLELYTRAIFTTAKAVAPHMAKRGSGVILTLSTPASRMNVAGFLGYGAACAAKERMSQMLAAELAPSGVRVICIRSHAIPEALASLSHVRDVFQPMADATGVTLSDMMASSAEATFLKRLPTLDQFAETVAFLSSDRAGAMTATVLNMSSGAVLD